MNSSIKPSFLVEQKRVEAILNNKRKTITWEERKKAHEEVQKSLEHYAGKLQEQIMVPIGKRGLMKGKLVNTNQVFVSLGSGWFTKVCSVEAQAVCSRRISECKEMLEKLEKERKLIEGWTSLPQKQQIFATEDTKEIIEPYDEKEEESWRREHNEKVKKHRQKLAEVRKELEENRGKEKTEEELWRHLDLLELQEEFEDELERLGDDQSDSSESSTLDSDDDSYDEDAENDAIVARNTITNSLRTSKGLQEASNTKKRNIQVKKSNKITDNNIGETNKNIRPVNENSSPLDSDDDSYEEDVENDALVTSNTKKSIIQVKKSNLITDKNIGETNKNSRPVKKVTFNNLPNQSKESNHSVVTRNLVEPMKSIAIGEIVERNILQPDSQESLQESRPVSKFKSSKRANKPN
ncbi:hypothetical protein O3M35_010292 [Rhynocoris fuscipes]|uniref:Unconventional prefoldin RPB5 interactor n=1 Tax=Rhynocoris fuscipes TaxID=488301 RepID=A0AAW1D5F9_9HEMI